MAMQFLGPKVPEALVMSPRPVTPGQRNWA